MMSKPAPNRYQKKPKRDVAGDIMKVLLDQDASAVEIAKLAFIDRERTRAELKTLVSTGRVHVCGKRIGYDGPRVDIYRHGQSPQ